MRQLKYLILHCTASAFGADLTGADVERLHRNVFRWSKVGYRAVVRRNGAIDRLVPANRNCFVEDEEVTWGAGDINAVSHHVVYVGGLGPDGTPADTRTPSQKAALQYVCRFYIEQVCPQVKVMGHNQVPGPAGIRACPSFWVPDWLDAIGFPDQNIYREDPHNQKDIIRTLKTYESFAKI